MRNARAIFDGMHSMGPAKETRTMKHLIPFVLLAVLVLSACARQTAEAERTSEEQASKNVRVLVIEPRDLREYLNISGPLRAVRATDLSTEEAGTVASIEHDKGSRVKKGDVIVLLKRELLAAQLAAARADRKMKAYNEERTRSLFEENSVSKQEMLLAHTQLENAKAAEEIARIRYERAAIKAPFDGIVTARMVEPGQLVVVGQKVARVVDPFTLQLDGGVTEKDIAYLKEGAEAEIFLDDGGMTAKGSVSWIGMEASETTGKFPVEIRIDNPDLRLRPGVVARARVLKTVYHDAVVIPRDAVVQRPGKLVVFVVEEDRAVERPVELGPDEGLMVLVRKGLRPGDKLVVRGQRDLSDGAPVVIQETATAPDGSIPSDPDVVREGAPR